MRHTRAPAVGAVVLWGLGLLTTGCADDASREPAREVSCEELDEQSDVEMVLCDDGETRIDRHSERPPATPEVERVE